MQKAARELDFATRRLNVQKTGKPLKTISSRHHHPKFDRKLSPALTVTPGEAVVFETLDACYGEVRSLEDFRSYRQQPPRGGNPVTGPVYIEGASPGNTLVVVA